MNNNLPQPEFRIVGFLDGSGFGGQLYRDDMLGCGCKIIFPKGHGQKRKEYRIDGDPRVFDEPQKFLEALKIKIEGGE